MVKANKFGLRKAAEQKRNKAAQRTPLPPRAGQIDDAREVIERAKAIIAGVDRKQEETLGPALKALYEKAEKNGKTPSPKKIKAAYESDQAAKSPVPAQRQPEMAPKRLPAEGGTRAPQPKAAAFGDHAKSLGWDVDFSLSGTTVLVDVVNVSRGDEQIQVEWQGGVFINNASYLRPDGSQSKPRNASHAKQIMALPAPTAAQLAARRASRERTLGAVRVPVRQIAFDMDLLTDPELAEALRGTKLIWINSISGSEEEDSIPPKAICYVDEGFSGRTVHFNGKSGARSVRVSSIIHVSGGPTIRRRKAS